MAEPTETSAISPGQAPPAKRSPLIFIFLTVLIDTIGFGIIMPVLPQLIMDIEHVNLSQAAAIAGWLMVTFAGLQFLSGPLMGNLSDKFGRRPVLLISLLAFGINYALMGFAPNLMWLFIGRAITGMAGAVYAPATAYIADITPPDKRAQSFALVGAAFGLGFVLGPGLGGLLGEFGPRAPFFAAAILAGINFFYGYFVLPESLPKERRRPFNIKRANPVGTLMAFSTSPVVLGLAVAAFFWQNAFHVYPSTWSFYVIDKFNWSPAMIGATLAFSGVGMALVQGLLTGRIVRAIGEARAAMLGIVAGTIGFVLYAFATEGWMLFAISSFASFQGIAAPSINAIMSKNTPPERQGELQGGVASLMGLSSITGPLLLTQTISHFTAPNAPIHFTGAAFAVSAVCGVIALSLLAYQFRPKPAQT